MNQTGKIADNKNKKSHKNNVLQPQSDYSDVQQSQSDYSDVLQSQSDYSDQWYSIVSLKSDISIATV